ILGKSISAKYSLVTYLNYALLSATVFWLMVVPPWKLVAQVQNPIHLLTLVVFAVTSILLPYTFFFLGLQRVPASRASIVSTFEPVVVALASWIFLSAHLMSVQLVGILLVCFAIVLVETTSSAAVTESSDTA